MKGGTAIVTTIEGLIEMMTGMITGGIVMITIDETTEIEMRTGMIIGGNSATTATAKIEIEMM
jgi:hypothetical protein